jgi:hypothetical protein
VRSRTAPRGALVVGFGNALEFYDFGTFAYFAIQIGQAFFPRSEPANVLLYSLAMFGAGFVTGPRSWYAASRWCGWRESAPRSGSGQHSHGLDKQSRAGHAEQHEGDAAKINVRQIPV